ncbi:exodeoxyribonuclease V subunit alpha [Agarivorans sp. 1_MG-2023]|uniref:exodeoxyribonuclease V subunit alpha n=1 Tax=Agarivorans sp. 1_MG-2023 TaxID=3062634 RepID=UPI0026E23463|nr:exodeoxyribonuclease V subunit alpha [Agarivorans sp. 1_MG-2023]MDO6763416.1 exodeoxyribonuclease V subunit alpha [Agarivorans sp. 1_MG-2023]
MSNLASLITSPALTWLQQLKQDGAISALDFHFAKTFASNNNAEALMIAAAMVSNELNAGHVCIDVAGIAKRCEILGHCPLEQYQNSDFWLKVLSESEAVQQADNAEQSAKPLVLQYQRVYLYRYWRYEQQIANYFSQAQVSSEFSASEIAQRVQQLFSSDWPMLLKAKANYPAQQMELYAEQFLDVNDVSLLNDVSWLQQLAEINDEQSLATFVSSISSVSKINWQQLAALQACYQARLVISGGPGTGKTTTVTRLLALLQDLHLSSGKPALNIQLVAPTGKAAARLSESIIGAKHQLNASEQTIATIPEQASTIHRLLGVIPGRAEFRHHADNPLTLDMLVVDEASMIDMPLMVKLLAAMPAKARIILLGDKDQLASVEAGAVLGDLCAFIDHGYSAELSQFLQACSGFDLSQQQTQAPLAIADKLCLLRKSYRFDARSGIGLLAKAVNQGRADHALELLNSQRPDLPYQSLGQEAYQDLLDTVVQGYQPYLNALQQGQNMQQVFELFHQFQLLVALRNGELGVSGLNQRIESLLKKHGLIERSTNTESLWYAGRPVMIDQNDHEQQLYNGDIGICASDENGQLMVAFESANGLRWLLPSRLPAHQSVYAMTVHKSQGSEFKHVAMLLPPAKQGLVNRELLYTAITRAKSQFSLYADAESISAACRNKTQRRSGLVERLAAR